MKDKKLMIGIPTKDHPRYMQYYLAKVLPEAKKYNIDIHIYDSSQDDKTKSIVEERITNGYSNLFYHSYHPDLPPEKKIKNILVGSNYEYIWLCGDGVVLNLSKDISMIEKEIMKNRDLIVISALDTIRAFDELESYKVYSDPLEFILEQWVPISLYGGAIYKNDIFTNEEWEKLFPTYTNDIQLAGLFDILARRKFNAVSIVTDFFVRNPYKMEATWITNGRELKVMAELIPNAVNSLPELYDPVKKIVSRLFADNNKAFLPNNLWELRASGNLSLKQAVSYRKKLKRVTSTKWFLFVIVSIVPKEFAWKLSQIFSE